jgi:hypothetical protein
MYQQMLLYFKLNHTLPSSEWHLLGGPWCYYDPGGPVREGPLRFGFFLALRTVGKGRFFHAMQVRVCSYYQEEESQEWIVGMIEFRQSSHDEASIS